MSSYFVCTSGVVYTMINPVPMFRFEPDKYGKYRVTEYFLPSSRGQYGGEGYIMSFLAIMVSAGFLFMIKVERFADTGLRKRVAIGIAIIVTFLTIQTYIQCYKIKTPWYYNNFMPPSNFMRGPIMRDQGNNI